MRPAHITATLTNEIYERIFGMKRNDMLAIAKSRPDYAIGAGSLYAVGDEDESMRDCFSEEALGALNAIESKITETVNRIDTWPQMNEQEKAAGLAYIVIRVCETWVERRGKVTNVWYESELKL